MNKKVWKKVIDILIVVLSAISGALLENTTSLIGNLM